MEYTDSNLMKVYDTIAPKFDRTRYRCWSTVESVLNTFEKNTLNGDFGCGNGKNMMYRNDLSFIGIDFSQSFVDICNSKGLECYKSDIRCTPFDDNYFDNTISIAVIHHLDSLEKRIDAINEMFRVTKKGGSIFIYVWALNQPDSSRRKFESQDNMVPFEYQGEKYYRFYHVYKENELYDEINNCSYNFKVIRKGCEMGNHYIHLIKT